MPPPSVDLLDRRLEPHLDGSSVPKCEAEGFLGVWANSLPGLSCRFDSQTVSGDGIVIHPLGPDRTRTVASVTIDIDLPPGVEVTGYV